MFLNFFKAFFSISVIITILFACQQINSSNKLKENNVQIVHHVQKPPSSFEDTLKIKTAAAVFYEPDSQQLLAIKAVTNEQVFKGSTHEYIYQIRNARKFLKVYWPHLKIIDAKNVRFLLFQKPDKTTTIIDLNKQNPYGMFIFDLKQQPLIIDMMNIDTQVPDYFSKKN